MNTPNIQEGEEALMNFDMIVKRYEAPLHELLSCVPRSFNENLPNHLPTNGGIYRVFTVDGPRHDTLYIGRTRNLQQRLYEDLYHGRHTMTLRGILERNPEIDSVQEFLEESAHVQFAVVNSLEERTFVVHFAVAVLRPALNL